MPTISFSLRDLNKLVGRNISIAQLEELVEYGKGELQGYDKAADEVSVNFDDTNLPCLWSVEGVAIMIKGILGKEKGVPKLKISRGSYQIIVDRSITKIRPFIGAFVAKGHKIDNYLIKQMVQLQEKLCENYGKRREKVAVGVYSYEKIVFPIYYKAVDPEGIKFVPLDFKKEMTPAEILEEHPKGEEYKWILESCSKYPILVDDKGEVLSFPPIINSDWTGKIEEKEEHIFVEATGTDQDSVLYAVNILAQAFHERGFQIYSVDVKYPAKKMSTPFMFNQSIKVNKGMVKELIGIELSDAEFKRLLEKARFSLKAGRVEIPCFRSDIMHSSDVIEDIAIAYGFNKIPEAPLSSYTPGTTAPLIGFIDRVRDIMIGFGFQEVMSPVLTNKKVLYGMMNTSDFGTIEIEDFSSETYSAVRSWIAPILMNFLSKNKHVDYPHKIFEEGLVAVRKGQEVEEFRRIAAAIASEKADYTAVKQVLDNLRSSLGFEYVIEEAEHDAFLPGRVGRVIVNGKKVAYIGELHPRVLSNFELEMPVVAFELNLTELFGLIK